ncbi:mitochondrial mRNA pseudouridine synthase TRUB2 isoform X2 [Rhinatrema bivittatum]|uniref:mitochondrial mRNA pseudouridine synthase TRUB2 isoform X2 n=1 Tax=Rhinatrema bivittatum TaxID=194408 RepID=UPI00112E4700|nr:mitochondrial mRNA pseudouridine synthase TRUB2 isoform X2 [Rhinatrema bivittatum]
MQVDVEVPKSLFLQLFLLKESLNMSRFAPEVYRTLQGLFAVYKPPGVHWKRVRDCVETNLLKDLNSLKQPAPRQQVRFLPSTLEGSGGTELTLTATILPVLADHSLAKGPNYSYLKIGAGHRLDARSSGVLVLGVGHGNKLLTYMYESHLTKEYTVHGLFGTATDDFSDTGRVIEKTTYDHVTRDKLERILAVIQGSNRKALLTHSRIDLKSQEAYELAVEGLIRPMEKSPPIITGIRCLHFAPPDFTLEIQCLHETQKYLRKIVHEIGLELKSSAVCTCVRRTRDGIFTLTDALLRTHWDLQSIQEAIECCTPRVEAEIQHTLALKDRLLGHSGDSPVQAQQLESKAHNEVLTSAKLDQNKGPA